MVDDTDQMFWNGCSLILWGNPDPQRVTRNREDPNRESPFCKQTKKKLGCFHT